MGAGFDVLGIGLCLYSTLQITETNGGLLICDNDETGFVPKDEKNLVYRAAMRVFDYVGYTPRGLKISQHSHIPMTRGLGSSSACIIGGMVAANIISGRRLSYHDILNMATDLEGHPDNVAPALYGGLCVSAVDNGIVYTKSAKISRRLKAAVFIPEYPVSTKKSRCTVPDEYSRKDAVFNISRAALMYAAMTSADTGLLKTACDDRMHQPYRKSNIEGYDFIFDMAYSLGAKAVYLSGSGPTIIAVIDGNYNTFREKAKKHISEKGLRIQCRILSIDNVGTIVKC